ncbi:MAG: hypothetical protein QOI56_847 [Actinomycetota bacterium]|nr:hypothetical protein [Actinomycetota bacterium]
MADTPPPAGSAVPQPPAPPAAPAAAPTGPAPAPPAAAPPAPPAAGQSPAGRGVAILLAASAIVAAVIGGRVAFRSFTATSLWQQSVRQQTKQAAAYVEDLRFVYTSEEPVAFSLSEAKFRAEELAKVAPGLSGLDRTVVELEQALQEYLSSGQVAEASPLFADPRYQGPNGFDIGRRLADQRDENPELLTIDPEKTRRAGNRASTHAVRLLATTIVVAVAFMFGSLAQGFPRRRPAFLAAGYVLLVAGVVSAVVVEVVS